MLVVAAAVFVIGGLLHLFKLAFTAMFGGAGTILLLVLVAAAGGYAWYRTQRTDDARALEGQLAQAARTATSTVTSRARSAWNNERLTANDHPATPAPQGWAQPPGQPHVPPPPSGTQLPGQPYVPPPGQPFVPPPPGAAPVRPVPIGGGILSALLVVPSLVVFALLDTQDFTSVWQPWWLLNGLNAYFVLCVAARAGHQRAGALLLALGGTVLMGLATSPGDWSLTAALSKERYVDGYTYLEPPYELLPWINRIPVLVAVVFVIAWSVARREHGAWALGLIPTAGLAWWSIWYSEYGMRSTPNWFTFWLLEVGVFVGGCLACLAAEAIARPRPQPGWQPPQPGWPPPQQ